MLTSCGKRVTITTDAHTRLPLMCTKPMKHEHAERVRDHAHARASMLRDNTSIALYVHTHISTLSQLNKLL